MKKNFIISGKVFKFPGKGGWYFVRAEKKLTTKLKGVRKHGFGSVKVKVKIGKTSWKTSLFPERKKGPYMFAIKSDVRKKEGITTKKKVRIHISLN